MNGFKSTSVTSVCLLLGMSLCFVSCRIDPRRQDQAIPVGCPALTTESENITLVYLRDGRLACDDRSFKQPGTTACMLCEEGCKAADGAKTQITCTNGGWSDPDWRPKCVKDPMFWCPQNMKFGNCSCGHRTCGEPDICVDTCIDDEIERCVCPKGFFMKGGACVPEQECGCYLSEKYRIIPEGETIASTGCISSFTCLRGRIVRKSKYECSPHAVCEDRNNVGRCYCKKGYTGDGETCDITDCMDVYNTGVTNSGVYTIKPTAWPGEPFDVFCNMSDGGGWTVFQRRNKDVVDFSVGWDSYREGFGRLNKEHWMGNEKLYYLTNHRKYELVIDIETEGGEQHQVKYEMFRVANETTGYRLLEVGGLRGIQSDDITWCPHNMVYSNCTCGQRTCSDPKQCINTCREGHIEGCICPEGYYMNGKECIPQEECGCYVTEMETVLPEDETFVNFICTRKDMCINGEIISHDDYLCHRNAVCESRQGVRRCYCTDDYRGDGMHCIFKMTDCMDIYNDGFTEDGLYLIKPPHYPGDPFEAFCNMSRGGGWTVLHRREDGIVNFNQDWTDYKAGFGNLEEEFWFGADKMFYLTNHRKYQLRIDMEDINGVKYHVTYDSFRIGNEAENYLLNSTGEFSGTTDNIVWCSKNMIYSDCTCGMRTCEEPYRCINTCIDNRPEGCICPEGYFMDGEDCIPRKKCGCYIKEERIIIPEGDYLVNERCSRKDVCTNQTMSRYRKYRCSAEATCDVRDGRRSCYCNHNYYGDGAECNFSDCMDAYNEGFNDSGIYTIKPLQWPWESFPVYCNMSDGGGWTVFQRRQDGTVNFFLGWERYKDGFGDLLGEHWLGNDKLFYLTNQRNYRIRIDLVDRDGNPYFAKFSEFRINNESDNYRLVKVGNYSGNADARDDPNGFALVIHENYQFSTKDQDNDGSEINCANRWRGAWWYYSCYRSNLNADYYGRTSVYTSISWHFLPGSKYFIQFTEMQIQPVYEEE